MLTATHCHVCGIEYGMPAEYDRARRIDGKIFYCPNGHQECYGETDVDKLKKQLDAAKRETEREQFRRQNAERERDTARKRQAKAEKRLTRIEERIAKGICPCCDRRFENLAQHVAEMHPDFAEKNPNIMSRFRGLLAQDGTHPEKS